MHQAASCFNFFCPGFSTSVLALQPSVAALSQKLFIDTAMPAIPLYTKAPQHPSSSEHEILNEPDWAKAHSHRIGFRDRENRYPGFTHHGDEWKREAEFEEDAIQREGELRAKIAERALLTVRDFMQLQEVRRPYYPR
jgi:hypothetical protein